MAQDVSPEVKPVGWVAFEQGVAKMRRVIAPNGIKGLLLRVGEGKAAEQVKSKALEFGFQTLKNPLVMQMLFPDGRVPYGPKALAEALGGHPVALSRTEFDSDSWTINLSQHAPVVQQAAVPKRISPDPANIVIIGTNIRGEEVIRDGQGRYFRKVSQENGKHDFVHEGEEDIPTLFLRAVKREDLQVISSCLIGMAARGTLHEEVFYRVIDAALEEGPHGKLEMHREDAAKAVRSFMMREITAIAIENDASRDKFYTALRISDSTRFVLSKDVRADGMLEPSAALASFLRRTMRGTTAIDFRGSESIKLAMPPVIRDGAPVQFHDLGSVNEDAMGPYLANVLARRDSNGRTIIRLPSKTSEETVEQIRSDIGRAFALEGVARIDGSVASGIQDVDGSIIYFIGERRPELLDGLPQAALRDINVITGNDLINLERDIVRARAKIRDFHQGVEAEIADSEDNREENQRQRPYQPISQVKEPFTMIPVALEGATAKAQRRVVRDLAEMGGVDAAVSSMLGSSLDALGEHVTSEQADAVAMWKNAYDRDRGFLIADATGVGKGRSMAAIVRSYLRAEPGRKVIYFTESAKINAPDVIRDLIGVGAMSDVRPLFLTIGTDMEYVEHDPVTGEEKISNLTSVPASRRSAIFDSETWPDDCNVIITNYSMFRSAEGTPSAIWLRNALDEKTLIALDECHNALNEKSAQGENIRAAMDSVVHKRNVVFASATPTRDPSGLTLYKPLMPASENSPFNELLKNIRSGGEVAQEAFTTMLAEDGVMLRRDHDLSNIEFKIELPNDELMLRYQQINDQFSPMVELMIDASLEIGRHMGRGVTAQYDALIARGIAPEAARGQVNAMNQFSNTTSPLINLAKITNNAIKTASVIADQAAQVVDVTLREIAEGRKPMIIFHSTNAALIQEMAKGEDGKVTEESMAAVGNLTLLDQIRRMHNNVYKVRLEGRIVDAREVWPDIAEKSALIEEAINRMPHNLPVSPVDHLIEQLEANGISAGEVSGRGLYYRDGRVQRRTLEDRDRRRTISKYNKGDLDVIIFNSAGATGGSMHASKDFEDQRPRTMIEIETPPDIIKYVQSLGRGNRYGQVARPRVVSVMTGLVSEMRLMQQRNCKLRRLGASVDGNRAHPMLLDDVPDLLNKVGDEATRNVLMSMPALARRLGFDEYAESDGQSFNDIVDEGSGTIGTGAESLANRALTRTLMLTAREQQDFVARVKGEFDSLIEELESRNANPLRPKELDGMVEIRATSIFSGQEREEGNLDSSAFLSPLHISTAVHHYTEDAWTGDRLVTEIESARRLYGTDGFRAYSNRITQNMPALLRAYLPEGMEIEEAMAAPREAGTRFERTHKKLTDLAYLLEHMVPGGMISFPDASDPTGIVDRFIVGLVSPAQQSHYDVPSAYKIKTIMPGMSKPTVMSLSRLIGPKIDKISFGPGLSEAFDPDTLQSFDDESQLSRRMPVQILSGNILQAINEAAQNNLGTISLYRDENGQVHRGIVVDPGKVDLTKLPVPINSGHVLARAADKFLDDPAYRATSEMFKIWGGSAPDKPVGERDNAELIISITPRTFTIDAVPLRKATRDFYTSRPGLYENLFGKELPTLEKTPLRAVRRGEAGMYRIRFALQEENDRNHVREILECMSDLPIVTDGRHRDLINHAANEIDLDAGDYVEQEMELQAGIEPEQAAEPVNGIVDIADIDMDDIEWMG